MAGVEERRTLWDERGYERLNVTQGEGGSPDRERLFTAAELADEIIAADTERTIERAEVVRRGALPGRGPIGALLVLHRPQTSRELDS